MDFILWPRNDIEKIVCLLFSRWKGADDEPYRPVQVRPIYSVGCRKRSRLRVKQKFSRLTGQVWISPWWLREAVLARSESEGQGWNGDEQPKSVCVSLHGQTALTGERVPWSRVPGFTDPYPWWCPDVVSRRLRKPRLQFSSCAAFAFTCPRISWPAGAWEA